MASTLLVILDDISTDFTYSGPQDWDVNTQPPWYGGTSTYPAFANASTFGSFEVTFEGTSIAFTGNTPPATLSQSITVSIDGGTSYNTTYMDPTPQTYLQWYQSPTLSEGRHTIKVDGVDGTSIDYATITVGQDTTLSGKKIIVDNDDPSVHYSGSWTRNMDEFIPGGIASGFPFRNSTHRSSTPGDTITFRFTGTSAAVYGIFSWGNLGTLAATYTIDGGTPTTGTYPVTTGSTRYINGALENSNFPFVSLDSLSAGDHTLVINVTQCQNHAFVFDYLIYSPSFANLASMPSLPFTSSASSSTSTPTPNSASAIPASASPTASQAPQQSAGSNVTHIGPIVGGAVGGFLALASVIFVLFWLRRRRISKENIETSVLPFESPITPSPGQLEARPFAVPAPGPSNMAELKQERYVRSSGTKRGLPSASTSSATTRSPSDVVSSHPTTLTNGAFSSTNPSSGGSVVDSSSEPGGPPAYETIVDHPSPSH